MTKHIACGDIVEGCAFMASDAYDYDELSRVTWARIPHFYSTPYYVYQYATSFSASAALAEKVKAAIETR